MSGYDFQPARRCARHRAGRVAGLLAAIVLLAGALRPVSAGEALVAVAANFAEALTEIEQRFEEATAHRLRVSSGATGALYAQIARGAPFDVLLAADQERPRRLESEGYAVAGSRFTYAMGRLALWSADPERVRGREALSSDGFRALAVANPALAPYGAAAHQALVSLGLYEGLRPRIVEGQNVAQTFALVATGNAELGFVALSQVRSPRAPGSGSRWEVPEDLYAPIRQDAVLLSRAAGNPAARDFLAYLRSGEARRLIAGRGYRVD